MPLENPIISIAAAAAFHRLAPRVGGSSPTGWGGEFPLRVDGMNCFKAEVELAAPGDGFSLNLVTGVVTPQGLPVGMTIAGTGVPAVAGNLLPSATTGGKASYSTDGYSTAPAGGIWVRLYWTASPARWNLDRYVNGALSARWTSTSATALPDDATGWTATAPATGVPTVSEWVRSTLKSVRDSGGKDPDGFALQLADIRLLTIAVSDSNGDLLQEGATLVHAAVPLPSIPLIVLGSRQDIAAGDLLGDPLVVTALAPNTRVDVLAWGVGFSPI